MYFAACIWPGDGEFWYLDRIDVAVEISGRVQWDIHWRHPISCCMLRRSLSRSRDDMETVGMESMGRPLRYGVFGADLDVSSSPISWARLSIKAFCERCTEREDSVLFQVNFIPKK